MRLQRCMTNFGGFLSWFGTLLAPSGEPPLVSARKLPSSSSRCSISRAREREWDIRRRQSVSSVILSSFVRSLR